MKNRVCVVHDLCIFVGAESRKRQAPWCMLCGYRRCPILESLRPRKELAVKNFVGVEPGNKLSPKKRWIKKKKFVQQSLAGCWKVAKLFHKMKAKLWYTWNQNRSFNQKNCTEWINRFETPKLRQNLTIIYSDRLGSLTSISETIICIALHIVKLFIETDVAQCICNVTHILHLTETISSSAKH